MDETESLIQTDKHSSTRSQLDNEDKVFSVYSEEIEKEQAKENTEK